MRFVAFKAKELRFGVDLTTDGGLMDESGVSLEVPAEWSAEHLLLAALARCSVESLRYHARRVGVDVSSASANTRTLVTKREIDHRYALVDTEVEVAVRLGSEPEPDVLAELLASA